MPLHALFEFIADPLAKPLHEKYREYRVPSTIEERTVRNCEFALILHGNNATIIPDFVTNTSSPTYRKAQKILQKQHGYHEHYRCHCGNTKGTIRPDRSISGATPSRETSLGYLCCSPGCRDNHFHHFRNRHLKRLRGNSPRGAALHSQTCSSPPVVPAPTLESDSKSATSHWQRPRFLLTRAS